MLRHWAARALLLLLPLWAAPPTGCNAWERGEAVAGLPQHLLPDNGRNARPSEAELGRQVEQQPAGLQPPVLGAGASARSRQQPSDVQRLRGGARELEEAEAVLQRAQGLTTTTATGVTALQGGGDAAPVAGRHPPAAPPPPPLANFESTPMPQPKVLEQWRPAAQPLELSSGSFIAKGHPQPAYLAMCVVARDAHADILEWVHHHLRLGVGAIYVMDHGSEPPMEGVLAPRIADGSVAYERFVNFTHASERPQLYAYDRCLQRHGHKHRWMAFIDVDEFLIFPGANPVRSLPSFLQQYEGYSGLAVHWVLFGSSGHEARPRAGTLRSYYRCLPLAHAQHTLVKTIVNLRCTASAWGPHAFHHNCTQPVVRTDLTPIEGPRAEAPVHSGLVLHHYALRSREEFKLKMARGSGMRRQRGEEYFWFLDGWSVDFNFDGFFAWDDLQLAPGGAASVDPAALLRRYANDTHEDHWLRGR